jgi:acyl transferase domain-containing protein/NAD(P)H-dependent flavin oxidoreductase YrpB (nitropropane dioxygenase family)/NAD(P)-dependent dehydrogenase (short-subunit alcohol dehydrogenase family)
MPLTAHPVIALSPFEHPDPGLVAAVCRAGALGVLDLGRDPAVARAALDALAREVTAFGVRVPEGVDVAPESLPREAAAVVLPAGADLGRWKPRPVFVQVTSIEEARAAVSAGADGLIAKGCESGGRVGDESSFILLQRLVAEVGVPVWVQGGVGLHTAAACIAGGAAGVVLDAQIALVRESSLPETVKAALAAMDGSETVVVGDHRLYARPDLSVAGIERAEPAEIAARLGATDLHRFLLPAGQDAAFARRLAERFRSAGGVVRAVAEAMRGNLRLAQALRPLAPGSALAAAHGLRVPVVQGPMTRVSDRAAGAAAGARAGGLPFLALSLLREPEVRALLTETAARLAGLPWGVGILGFVPPVLREEQLAVIREVRPPAALIAGGRPSQARPLEAQGIATYLHVPSPGLLDLFLKEGARRFVFEGRECGGHVGPRTSFVLWEQQIEELLRSEVAEEVSVLFAGGIHDARSAAMVAALAAPLAARGTRIGVLMGTAYLFTEEAVATGAIQPAFQRAAIECDRTALLETAPGHSTRCIETPYVRAFREEKRRLAEAGLGAQERWAALERLNLGRLRIAAKGLKREGEVLVPVGEAEQRSEGMYMIGQVAALRSATTTVADLHRDVSEGATELLARVAAPEEPAPGERPAPARVAIIGMACIFPGAPDLASFWANVAGGVNSVTDVPRERWDPEIYYDPRGVQGGDKTNSKWGGFIPDVPFDPVAYGIPPRSLASIEPVQLLSLEVARRALADAGYADRDFDRQRVSVIFGAEAGTDLAGAYGFRALYPQYLGEMPRALDESLPTLTEDSFPGVLANVIAGRIANRLDLGGVNYTVDAACASSLAAVDLAVKELVAGTSDMVLCGGADLHNSIGDYLLFSSVHALSPRGRCATFDAEADGIVLGEGVAVLVLKRLRDAVRDGDRIYAILDGIAGSSDGKCLGLTAPRKEGQVRALERAYARAGVSPAEVGLVEAHGTGTVVGDRTELQALTEVFGRAGARPGSCALGSVKSQIGHTKCAAGMAGLIKAALSLYHRALPPTLHIRKPNPYYDPAVSPFTFGDVARPWPGSRRHAAVSAFGFGGTNFHAVLSEHEAGRSPDVWPAELFVFRAPDAEAARREMELLARVLERDGWRLRDLARSVWERGRGPARAALVAGDLEELRSRLAAAIAGRSGPGVWLGGGATGKVAFLFPGQGSQRPQMLRDLFLTFPRLQRFLALGEKWASRIFPPAAFGPEERAAQRAALTDTRVAQPALGIAGLAVAELLSRLGVRPDMAAGHSYGELVALAVAGAIGEEDLFALSEARGECIVAAAGSEPGTMAAVSAGASDVEPVLAGLPVVLANRNAPDQTVIAGPVAAIEEATRRLGAAGLAARRIEVACAFHSPIVAPARESFGRRLAEVAFGSPRIPVYSNATAAPYPADPEAVRKMLADHVALPVRFADEIEAMYDAGARIFVEAGPGRVLSGLVARILKGRPHVVVSCEESGEGLAHFLGALAKLAVHGVAVDAGPLFAERDARVLDLENPPVLGPAPTAWVVNGQRARPLSGEAPRAALRPVKGPVAAPAATDRDGVILEFFRSMREVVASQREVMLRYLGEASPERPAREDARPAIAEVAEAEVAGEPSAAVGLTEMLVGIVSERTGYPPEMLELDLDLEADLSIDSIKRIEIVGALAERLGMGLAAAADRDQAIEELAGAKTLRAILEWLEHRTGAPRAEMPAVAEPAALPAPSETVQRYVLSVEPVPEAVPDAASLAGRTFAVTDDGRVAPALRALLEAQGASARVLRSGEPVGTVDGLIDLASLVPGSNGAAVKDLFERSREALRAGASSLVAVTGLGGSFGVGGNGDEALGGGVAGLLKSVHREWPDVRVRIVDVDPREEPARLAELVLREVVAPDDRLEVGYAGGIRVSPRIVPAPRNGAGDPGLGPDAVVLVTGGARGITARVALALARRCRCRLELVGRSPLPDGEEDADLAAARDLPAIRRLLVGRAANEIEPAAIEAAAARIVAAREVRSTLAAIREAGAPVVYHSLDVRDDAAFAALVEGIYARHGRLDGVIHGAGIIEDKLLVHKTRESFDRVFDTKLAGARTLARVLRDDVRFVVFFSSVSGAFGNRGQVDYAAAADALDKLAWSLRGRFRGRVVSIDWGPWAETGMVSPELAREYERRGIRLIAPECGAEALFAELCEGGAADAQVILTAADPSVLGQVVPPR